MRSCPWRFSPLGQSVRWPLLLAVLIFLLYTLPSFIKEPSTKPSSSLCSRYQYVKNIGETSGDLLQKALSQTPILGQRTSVHAEAVQGNGALDIQPKPTGHTSGASRKAEASQAQWQEGGSMPNTATRAVLKRQEKERTVVDTQPPRGQDKEMASVRSKELARQSQDMKTSRERKDQQGTLTTIRTVSAKHQVKAATTAKALTTESQKKMLTTAGAVSTRMRKKAMTTAAVTVKEKKVQATPPPAPFPSPTTPRSQALKAANFKSEPRWDFEEQYNLDVGGLQTVSLCHRLFPYASCSGARAEDGWLSTAVPFRALNGAPPKVVTHFPPVPQQQLLLASLPPGSSQCVTCAVVGNGGILNDSRVGRDIDSHDYVFRLSGAVIKGYEQDVGTRTSFYGFTAFSLTQSLLILGRRGFQHVPLGKDVRYLHFLEGTRDYEWLEAMLLNQTLAKKNLFWFRRRPQEAFQEALKLDRYLLLHPDFLRYMKNRFLRSKTLTTTHWRIYRPTTGALLLLTALHLCDKVSAYGFITEGYERFSDHYYDQSWKRLIFYINHDFALERTVWKRLHDEGIIWLYQRPQTAKAKD
uniref:alpha-N-acetylgalactosaminide alpha-2,6-sialyltransferase n=1 Tax=Castor canadensis TaxID=51338 RepID=A0A8C0WYZ2_CASCN